MTVNIETTRVGLGHHSYDVVIGPSLIADAARRLAPHIPRKRTAIVSDLNVAALHGQALLSALQKGGIAAEMITVPAGEESKSFQTLAMLIDRLLALELDRGDVIIAFGGGVVGDLAGFAAAIYKRGIDFIQIPTTLLAQVDSSVGGKTAIDTPRGKNLVGAFHQPRLVLADLDVLGTLANRQMRSGFGEILKYGLLGNAAFFSWLEQNGLSVVSGDTIALTHAVSQSVRMKADIVARDEQESGQRALLNLGHTFAHALEAETKFGDFLLHGEAVALGCAMAFRFSAAQDFCPPDQARRAEKAIAQAGLPVRLSDLPRLFSAEPLMRHMMQDKKAEAGRLTLVLARAIGKAFVARNVDRETLHKFLIAEGAMG